MRSIIFVAQGAVELLQLVELGVVVDMSVGQAGGDG